MFTNSSGNHQSRVNKFHTVEGGTTGTLRDKTTTLCSNNNTSNTVHTERNGSVKIKTNVPPNSKWAKFLSVEEEELDDDDLDNVDLGFIH